MFKSDDLIDSVILCKIFPFYLRWDVLPFVISYSILFTMVQFVQRPSLLFTFVLITIPILLSFHLFLFLLSESSVSVKRFLGFVKVKEVSQASHAYVKAAKNVGQDRIVSIIHLDQSLSKPTEFKLSDFKISTLNSYFEFQKVKYSFSKLENRFIKIEYLAEGKVREYLAINGIDSQENIYLAQEKWGKNSFDIPLPSFLDLYAEHLTAPFFIFQVVCLVLWCKYFPIY